MRFGGSGFCRQSFGASLCDLLKIRPSTRRRAALSNPLSSGARRSPKGGYCIDDDAISGLDLDDLIGRRVTIVGLFQVVLGLVDVDGGKPMHEFLQLVA